MNYPVTPDGRYFVVRGRLWRCSNPTLSAERRTELTRQLMQAWREKAAALRAGDVRAKLVAKERINQVKQALGERGPVWWTDGAPDWNRRLAKNTPYADWFRELSWP
jgi:hypothetical protein